jgi:hypothetical protein
VECVRDAAGKSCDRRLQSDAQSAPARRWRKLLQSTSSEAVARGIIPDVVDSTIFHLLQAIDQQLLDVLYRGRDANVVALADEGLGELSGWYMGSEGWRRMFSKERFNDPFDDGT